MDQRPVHLTKETALELIGQFLPLEWKRLNAGRISVQRSAIGNSNEVYFVSRNLLQDEQLQEPSHVVIRLYNQETRDTSISTSNNRRLELKMQASEIEQIATMTALADRGLGPKLLGIFDGGRIEEYIDCHNITSAEARDPVLEADIAVNMARIHATRVPLRKPNCLFVPVLREIHTRLLQNLPMYETLGDQQMLAILKHDFQTEFQMMEPQVDFANNRMVLMNWDTHQDNIAVQNKASGDKNQLKTMIFDFEMAGYNIRGKDLGLFLISRSGFFPVPSQNRKLESMEEFVHFMESYQREVVKEFPDADVAGLDSLNHLWVESLVGGMISSMMLLLRIANRAAEQQSEGHVGRAKQLIPCLFDAFQSCKAALSGATPSLEPI